jgi:hypothetical protein
VRRQGSRAGGVKIKNNKKEEDEIEIEREKKN